MKQFSALVFFLLAGTASAAEVTVSGGLSTLGIDAGVTVPLSEQFPLRCIVGGGKFSRSEEISGNPADVDLTLGGVALLGDWYPQGGGFFLSGGPFCHNTKQVLFRQEAWSSMAGCIPAGWMLRSRLTGQ